MPFTYMEGFADLPPLLEIGDDAKTGFAAMPPAGARKAVDWVKFLGLGGVSMAVAESFDTIKGGGPVTLEEVLQVLGIQDGGIVFKLLKLEEKIAAQIKD